MAEDIMSITPLGSGQEVGRSCHVIEFRGMKIMLDIGIHPGYDGMNGLPYLDRIELEQIDVLLITHFHLDHAASLPYLTERTNFKGRIFMTHPTKAVLRLLLSDYIRLLQMKSNKDNNTGGGGGGSGDNTDILYTEHDLAKSLDKVELIDYHTTVTIANGISFYALNAGHVLGACMYWIEMGGRTILYTGDYSMEDDRHLMAAEIPIQKPDVLIVEATYGVQVHATKIERESRFTSTIDRIVSRGGKCLIPVFALGRAQELLLILDEYWQQNSHLHNIPIYYASKMASRALRVYQTYANMMNQHIRNQMDISNPFSFQYISNLKSIDVHNFDDNGPCVVFASPGMLQSGVSRQLFDRWASDSKNGVMIAGYAVEHTLAKEIMLQPKDVMTLDGRKQPLNCLIDYVSFSAHVDFVQNRSFITQVQPKHIILVHGQKDEMGRLKSALLLQYKQYPESKRPTITMPPNQIEVKLKFPRRRSAKVMGTLASDRDYEPIQGEHVRGILVTHNFHSKIVSPEDLATYTPLRVGTISSKLHVPFVGSIATLRLFLNEVFAGIQENRIENPTINQDDEGAEEEDGDDEIMDKMIPRLFLLHDGQIKIKTGVQQGVVTIEWQASPAGDIIADSVVALIMHAQSSVASIRLSSKPCRHPNDNGLDDDEQQKKKIKNEDGTSETINEVVESRLRYVHALLKDQFQNVDAVYDSNIATFEIVTDSGLVTTLDEDNEDEDNGKFLKCLVTVEVDKLAGDKAEIKIECRDEKFAANIQKTLRNALETFNKI